MPPRTLATAAGLVGAVVCVARLFVGSDALTWLGLGLLAVAVGVGGTALVREPWVKVVSGVGAVLLAGSLLQLALDAADDELVVGLAGAGAALVIAVTTARRPSRAQRDDADAPAGGRRGNHRH